MDGMSSIYFRAEARSMDALIQGSYIAYTKSIAVKDLGSVSHSQEFMFTCLL